MPEQQLRRDLGAPVSVHIRTEAIRLRSDNSRERQRRLTEADEEELF